MQTSDDGLLDNRIRILQPKKGYRVAIDTVLLAAAVPARAGEHVLDIGCGVGGAALCLATRCPGVHVTGLESKPDIVALAEQNAERNGSAETVRIIRGSVSDIVAGPLAGRFDHAMANPPYYEAGEGTASPSADKEAAQRRHGVPIAEWVVAALAAVKPSGSVTFIYPADREAEITQTMTAQRAGEVCVLPLLPKAGRPAKRAIIQYRGGGAQAVRRIDGFVLHRDDGRFTDAADRVLRDVQALSLLRT